MKAGLRAPIRARLLARLSSRAHQPPVCRWTGRLLSTASGEQKNVLSEEDAQVTDIPPRPSESSPSETIDTSEWKSELKEEADAETFVPPPNTEAVKGQAEKHEFQAETTKILDIMAHSLYTDKEVFLRELISNASDALEKARYLQSTNVPLIEPDKPFEIRIYLDEKNNTVIIQDTGVGMTKEELSSHLGTIARSGSKRFAQEIAEKGADPNNIIGQFGVGFYSVFMVANRVTVFSKSARLDVNDPGHAWTSDGHGSYEIAQAEGVGRGTKIIIHLKPECKEFTSAYQVEGIIKKYSNFVGFPIYLNDKRINVIQALWALDRAAMAKVTDEEHAEFYRLISQSYGSPTYRLHFTTDVPIDIKALFYFPDQHMEKFGMARLQPGVSLYSRKVLIQAKSKQILPEWLRFVKGVVDSEDIPLNISRENMQDSALIAKINKTLTKRIIKFLEDESRRDPNKYKTWYTEFGSFIKEGVCQDWQNKSEIARLLRYETSAEEEGKVSSLDDYIARMPPSQNAIYYLVAPTRDMALASPYYEPFAKRKIEVIFCYNHIDEFVMAQLGEYNKRKIVNIEQGDLSDLKLHEEQDDIDEKRAQAICQFVQQTLKDVVSSVTVSKRLVSSPAVVVGHESAAIRRFIKYVDQASNPGSTRPLAKQRLEINPRHPILANILEVSQANPEVAKLVVEQIFDNALIAADILDNPRTMLGRLNKLLEQTVESTKAKPAASTSNAVTEPPHSEVAKATA